MKELTMNEVNMVSGGHDDCGGGIPPAPPPGTLEGWYDATVNLFSHIMDRIANR